MAARTTLTAMASARLWLARIVMLYALLIFSFPGYLYMFEPQDHIVVVNACAVAGRLYGMGTEGVSPLQWTELRDEGLSWLLFVAALAAYPRNARPTEDPT